LNCKEKYALTVLYAFTIALLLYILSANENL